VWVTEEEEEEEEEEEGLFFSHYTNDLKRHAHTLSGEGGGERLINDPKRQTRREVPLTKEWC
jgi:hypothetical protein